MFAFAQFDEMSGHSQDIDIVNPAMVNRLRAQADNLDRYQIAAQLSDAVAAAADAARTCRWQAQASGEASPDAIVDQEYYDDLVSAWTLIAAENQLMNLDTLFAYDGSVH